jgi:hypothetical protein
MKTAAWRFRADARPDKGREPQGRAWQRGASQSDERRITMIEINEAQMKHTIMDLTE